MKSRTDFAENSSGSSFILARGDELTEMQKATILEFVEQGMLGERLLTPENTEEEIQAVFEAESIDTENQKEIRKALKAGKSIYMGAVCFESEDELVDLYATLWEALEETGDGGFEIIDEMM